MSPNSNDLQQAIELIRGDQWDEAHEIVQVGRDKLSCWIHAWLHRKEGDDGNARYWYDQAGQSFPNDGLEPELERIAILVNEV